MKSDLVAANSLYDESIKFFSTNRSKWRGVSFSKKKQLCVDVEPICWSIRVLTVCYKVGTSAIDRLRAYYSPSLCQSNLNLDAILARGTRAIDAFAQEKRSRVDGTRLRGAQETVADDTSMRNSTHRCDVELFPVIELHVVKSG